MQLFKPTHQNWKVSWQPQRISTPPPTYYFNVKHGIEWVGVRSALLFYRKLSYGKNYIQWLMSKIVVRFPKGYFDLLVISMNLHIWGQFNEGRIALNPPDSGCWIILKLAVFWCNWNRTIEFWRIMFLLIHWWVNTYNFITFPKFCTGLKNHYPVDSANQPSHNRPLGEEIQKFAIEAVNVRSCKIQKQSQLPGHSTSF